MRELQREPRHGHALHPRPDGRDDLAGEEKSVVPVSERAEHACRGGVDHQLRGAAFRNISAPSGSEGVGPTRPRGSEESRRHPLTWDHRRVSQIAEDGGHQGTAARVWAVVQEDVENAPRWSSNLASVEKLDAGPPGKGTRYRYQLELPGGHKATIEVEQDRLDTKPKRCAGQVHRRAAQGHLGVHLYARRRTARPTSSTRWTTSWAGCSGSRVGCSDKQYAAGIQQEHGGPEEVRRVGQGTEAEAKLRVAPRLRSRPSSARRASALDNHHGRRRGVPTPSLRDGPCRPHPRRRRRSR